MTRNSNVLTSLSNLLIQPFYYFVLFFVDPRTKDWFLMSSPLPTLSICLAYVFTVKIAGPRLMANRKPMELRNVLIAYNLFQVLFSSWLFYEVSVENLYSIQTNLLIVENKKIVKAIVQVLC